MTRRWHAVSQSTVYAAIISDSAVKVPSLRIGMQMGFHSSATIKGVYQKRARAGRCKRDIFKTQKR